MSRYKLYCYNLSANDEEEEEEEKDERALAVEQEEIERLSIDRDDEIYILDRNISSLLKEFLLNKVALSGPGISKKGTKISQEYIENSSNSSLWDFVLQNNANQKDFEEIRSQYESARNLIEEKFQDKVDKVSRGDDLLPGVMKCIKVYVAVKRKLQPGDKMTVSDFSVQIKEGTKKSHSAAENTSFVASFLRGVVSKESYKALVKDLYYVYRTMEEEIEKHKDHPIVGKLNLPELNRVNALA